jgi:hypothetical protein
MEFFWGSPLTDPLSRLQGDHWPLKLKLKYGRRYRPEAVAEKLRQKLPKKLRTPTNCKNCHRKNCGHPQTAKNCHRKNCGHPQTAKNCEKLRTPTKPILPDMLFRFFLH